MTDDRQATTTVVFRLRRHWATVVPLIALVALVMTFGQAIGPVATALVALVLVGAVLAAVHHAEIVAHRVGEPYGRSSSRSP